MNNSLLLGAGMVERKSRSALVKARMVEAIRRLYPTARGVYIVGSVAREEAVPDSDMDILILLPPGTKGWPMIRRDSPLRREFPEIKGRRLDFILQVEGGPSVGQHYHRRRLGWPTPLIPLWEAG